MRIELPVCIFETWVRKKQLSSAKAALSRRHRGSATRARYFLFTDFVKSSPPMDAFSQNPFALLTLIAAPAILTNATSVLALSTSNRFLRANERMRDLTTQLESANLTREHRSLLISHVNRVEKQALALLIGFVGAGGLVWGCVHLFRATQSSMITMSEQAQFIRSRERHFEIEN